MAKTITEEFRKTKTGEIPEDWKLKSFNDAIDDNWTESKESEPKNSYKLKGKYPIVDQSNELIAGYTDDEKKVYRDSIPLIIFGDHTRIFKYIDFPFVTGADGTQLIKANKELYDPKFLYYACKHLNIPNRGYNRHFKILKEQFLPYPPKPEQKKIAYVLSKIRQAVENHEKIVVDMRELKSATMAKLFREGLRGEPLKQTEIGEIPQSWEVIPFGETCHDFFGGGTPSTKNPEYWNGDINWTTSAHISGIFLQTGQKNITNLGLANSSSNLVPAGNLLLGTRVGVGKVTINQIDVAISQDITGCIVKREKFISEYLAFALLTTRCQQFFAANKRGATIKGIPREDVVKLLLSIPKTKQEQQEVVNLLLMLEKINNLAIKRLEYLESLFSSTLNQLMTSKKRVKDINIEGMAV